uniref:Uncharacterized protein n=1 Tax=Amphimedon queenslandica TaxID=400682 RepID=A0A1X7TM91_AMPQE
HETFITSMQHFLSDQRKLKKQSLKARRGFLCPQAVAMDKFIMSNEVQKTINGICKKKRNDNDDEIKIARAYLKRRKQSFRGV